MEFKSAVMIGSFFLVGIVCLSADKVISLFLILLSLCIGFAFVSVHYRNLYEELKEDGF